MMNCNLCIAGYCLNVSFKYKELQRSQHPNFHAYMTGETDVPHLTPFLQYILLTQALGHRTMVGPWKTLLKNESPRTPPPHCSLI